LFIDYFVLFYNLGMLFLFFCFFFFNDTATTEIYTLSLHDALPICGRARARAQREARRGALKQPGWRGPVVVPARAPRVTQGERSSIRNPGRVPCPASASSATSRRSSRTSSV